MRANAANRRTVAWLVMAGVVAALSVGASSRAAPPTASEQLARAVAYENGEGVPKDALLAGGLYSEAAGLGTAVAA
jgi:TPR repeat protein